MEGVYLTSFEEARMEYLSLCFTLFPTYLNL